MNTKMNLGKGFELQFLFDLQKCIKKSNKQCQVFAPLIDDNGIDYVIRTNKGNYIEIQVKGRAEKRLFTITDDFKPRKNYWFVFYCKDDKEEYQSYVLSSQMVKKRLKGKHINITADKQYNQICDIFNA